MRRRVSFSLALVPFVLALAWAAAGVALAGGGCHGGVGADPAEGTATVIKIDGCTFAPTVTRVAVGTEVRFLNTSPQPHDVTGRNGEWRSDTLQNGQSFAFRFAAPGLYPYSCSLHPGMAGVVAVGASVAANDAAEADNIVPVSASAPAAPVSAGDSTLPILAAGSLGILVGAVVAGTVVSRRRQDI